MICAPPPQTTNNNNFGSRTAYEPHIGNMDNSKHSTRTCCGATYWRQYYRQYYCTTAVVLALFPLARFAGTTAVP